MRTALYISLILLNIVIMFLILIKPSEIKTDILGSQMSNLISRANRKGEKLALVIGIAGLIDLVLMILLLR